MDNEAKLFPKMIQFRQTMLDYIEATGNAAGLHREQQPDGRWTLYRRGYYQGYSGTRYSYRQYPKKVNGQEVMEYKATQVANYAIQGEASFMMTVAMGRIMRWLVKNDFFHGKVKLINSVHDAAYTDCHSSVAELTGKALKSIMESTPQYIAKRFNWDYIQGIPFKADAESGPDMFNQHHMEI